MTFWIFSSIILLIAAIWLAYSLRKKTAEKSFWEKRDKRDWTLKVALEKTFKLPTIESIELEKIEPQLDLMMKESIPDAEKEEKMRAAIMALYADKYEGKGKRG